MKLLIDASLDVRMRHLFVGHDARTARYMEWHEKLNGELLALAREEFDVLITADQGIPDQQNLTVRDVAIIVLEGISNSLDDLAPLVPEVLAVLRHIRRGQVVRISHTPTTE